MAGRGGGIDRPHWCHGGSGSSGSAASSHGPGGSPCSHCGSQLRGRPTAFHWACQAQSRYSEITLLCHRSFPQCGIDSLFGTPTQWHWWQNTAGRSPGTESIKCGRTGSRSQRRPRPLDLRPAPLDLLWYQKNTVCYQSFYSLCDMHLNASTKMGNARSRTAPG